MNGNLDQSSEIGTFDVVTTRSYMLAHEARLLRAGALACQPLCDNNPAGAALWDAVHQAGSAAELTHGPDEADDKERDDRMQIYGADIHTTTARDILQDQAETHEMNGWYIPGATRSFVAFLEDKDGDPIGEDRLQTIVSELKGANHLPDKAIPSICGWTPDADFSGTGGTATCEVTFEYEGPGDGETNFKDGYKDKCDSPTYVCGAQNGGAWYANFDCLCGTFPVEDGGLLFGLNTDLDNKNLRDYVKFHFVVAPTLPDCGVREPGFITSHQDVTESQAFLAHDVDVYTNAAGLESPTATRGTTAVTGTATDVAQGQAGSIVGTIPGVEGNQISPPPQVSKEDRVEPNADPVAGLSDTSQSFPETHPDGETLQRTLESPCAELLSGESSDTVDPWVDLVDGETNRVDSPRSFHDTQRGQSASFQDFRVQASPGLYQNDDTGQDNDNHPGPSLYSTTGNVGFFTDKNDDGDYEAIAGDTQTFSDFKTNPKSIQQVGAYPMLWDVRVQESGGQFELDTDAGCIVGTSGKTLTEGAEAGGFGAQTGLFQAMYLREPTAFVHDDTGDVREYPSGNNIYLFLSDSARQMYESPIETEIDAKVQDTIDELEAYVTADGDPAPDVVQPGEAFGLSSDYEPQCPEPTGGFSNKLSFAHSCQVDCSEDTIVTRYVFELDQDTIGGSDATFLPEFNVNGETFQFGSGHYDWVDVDPFDNDPSRQDDTDHSPPTGSD